MNTTSQKKGGYSFLQGLARAKKHPAYYEEGLFLDVSARVVDAMEAQGVSRSALARRLKVSPAYVTKVLRGHANLSLESLAKIAFALDMRWECLMLPAFYKLGTFALIDEHGESAIRTVETATIRSPKSNVALNDEFMPGKETTVRETEYELSIPA
jgi:transcriptional regulator with XRE-family HTH domain